jgi:hypothetical protein
MANRGNAFNDNPALFFKAFDLPGASLFLNE